MFRIHTGNAVPQTDKRTDSVMDSWCDPRVAAAERLHEELYGAFSRRAVRTEPSAPLTIDLTRLLGVLRDLKRMHAACELETEMYLRRELAGESEDVALSFGRVETLFNAVVRFQTAEGLSTAERRSRVGTRYGSGVNALAAKSAIVPSAILCRISFWK